MYVYCLSFFFDNLSEIHNIAMCTYIVEVAMLCTAIIP